MGVARATQSEAKWSKRLAMRTVLLPSCLLVAACTASADAVEPPANLLYYETGMATSPDDTVLFVVNANSNLQYDSGSISVLDLAKIDTLAANWESMKTAPDGCTQDTTYFETLVCDQASATIQATMRTTAGARVGNFATDIGVQDTGSGNLRLIVPTRGDPSIT
jgi:hypothetical protein